jgi:hypothetical protein
MPKGPVKTPITDQEIAFAHLVLAGKLTDREAAEAVGISASQAAYVKGKPRVEEYMASHRASVRAAMVEHESAALVEFNIGREQIMAQYWTLARLPATDTNGNITGQVKALDSLREMLGLVGQQAGAGIPLEKAPDVYRAAWMREADGEAEEDDMGGELEIEVAPPPQKPETESRPAPAQAPQLVASPAANRPRIVAPAEPYEERPGANFGRFQGM